MSAVIASVPTLNAVAVSATFSLFRMKEDGVDDPFSFVRAYDPKSVEVKDFRHAVIRYRNTENAKLANVAQKAAQMVTVPQIKLPEDYLRVMNDKAQKVFVAALEDAEDGIIRSMIDTGSSNIPWSVLGIEKALDFLTAERLSKRLTKESIEAWFAVAGRPWCDTRSLQICEAKSITKPEDVEKQKAGTFNAYAVRIAKLGAPVPNLGQEEAIALKNMLLTSKLQDDMAKVLLEKLTAILQPKVASEDL